jgi:hypothetical protein
LSDDDAVDCPQCGVVFAKFQQRAAVAALGAAASDTRAGRVSAAMRDPTIGLVRLGRAALLVALFVWTVQFARAPMSAENTSAILYLPNLVFHEAGHVLFGLFGRFMTVLGGSLLQFLVPIVLAVAFLRQKTPFGAIVCAWWAGENLVDVAPYIADARALELVLLGGRTGAEVEGHDWEYLLGALGLLGFDVTLGRLSFALGAFAMLGALGWGVVVLGRAWPQPRRARRSSTKRSKPTSSSSRFE